MIRIQPQEDTFKKRTAVVTVFLLLAMALICFRLFSLQIINGSETRGLAEDQYSYFKQLQPTRGEIKLVDARDYTETFPVVANVKKYLVFAVPGEIENSGKAAKELSEILDLDEADTLSKITQLRRQYVPLKKQITDEERQAVKDLKLTGIYFDSEVTRVYPEKNMLSQTLGFVGFRTDYKEGLYGLERYFEKDLAGQNGSLRGEKDSAGGWIFGGKRELVPATDGVNLILTIDKNIQFKVEQVLKAAVEDNKADGGTVIVANPKTGAILAIANYPNFDPNNYSNVEDQAIFSSRAVVGNYEPGSVFKPITMAAALNEGAVEADTTYNDEGFVEIDNYTIKNSDGKAHGEQTMTQVLEQSLNTGVIFAKEQIGNKKFYEYVQKFGFGRETGIEVRETVGNLDNLKANIKVNFHTASFGQGISVTPIQLIQAFTAIANQGKMMRPFLVQSEIYSNGDIKKTEVHEVETVISKETANKISAMLVNVVESGHGKKAAVDGYYIAGKTGTAQVPKQNGKGYEENINIGSFIGYGPVENPKFLMLVRIDHPRTVQYAETTAAPAFGEIAKFILNYFQVPPTRN
ncbi:MAG: hypothetical protein COT92_00695 [Candidatus Doudnabacteria bacterium CG10_big_fil_rev_8_21_14_0_10_42_18]|uniref:Penicillin-binding protein 2 n=1 Tax=Candidatus Doudnabacteria bacterium CG10_big_fil_rev_8_21_14_0_10_42_18 TaxID=1974552 RepID=A0A2H0VBR9_9BACT|nr:MAG: hypothetical protein COT92_00695 [Candidatus Doudnabacteria bacterium CG10_big_fil_rev_8_21_14_0_10_42_18]